MLRNTKNSYGVITKFFHWLIAAMIIVIIALGLIMSSMEAAPIKFKLYGLHKALGVLALLLAALRLLWRLTSKAVEPLAGMPPLMRLGSRIAHFLLYVFMLLMPVSGVLMSRFAGFDVPVFGLFTIPALQKNPELARFFHQIHELAAHGFIIMILIHAGAAIYHHFIRKDKTLLRMIK